MATFAATLREAGFRPVQVAIAGEDARITVEGGRYATLAQAAGRVARAAQPYFAARGRAAAARMAAGRA